MYDTISPEIASLLVAYDPETGLLTYKERSISFFICKNQKRSAEWRAARWNSRHSGKPAFTSMSEGYLRGTLLWTPFKAHRVAFCIYYGKWPSGQVDHINGIRTDNRICNLRDVSHIENSRNMKINPTNKSGTSGVVWNKREGKWKARISTGTARICLGTFANLEDAVDARLKAERTYGYHANHGRKV